MYELPKVIIKIEHFQIKVDSLVYAMYSHNRSQIQK